MKEEQKQAIAYRLLSLAKELADEALILSLERAFDAAKALHTASKACCHWAEEARKGNI